MKVKAEGNKIKGETLCHVAFLFLIFFLWEIIQGKCHDFLCFLERC